MDILYGAGTTRLQLLFVQAPHVSRGKVLQLDTPQGGFDVYPYYLLVPLKGCLPDRVPHGVIEPTIKVTAKRQAARIEGKATISIRYGLP